MSNDIRKAIFERRAELIESHPADGINAAGDYSENVHAQQVAFLKGIRCGTLAAANVACPRAAKTQGA